MPTGSVIERGDDRTSVGTAVRSREEVVLAAKRDRPDRALGRVDVELDAAIVEEEAQSVPPGTRIADRFGKSAARRHAQQLVHNKQMLLSIFWQLWSTLRLIECICGRFGAACEEGTTVLALLVCTHDLTWRFAQISPKRAATGSWS